MDWIKYVITHLHDSKYLSNQLTASESQDGGLVHLVPGRDAGPVMLVSSLRYNLGSKLQKLRQRWAREMTWSSVQMMLDSAANPTHTPP